MAGLYDAALYRFDQPVPSFWEAVSGGGEARALRPLAGDVETEVAVIGGGYTGLSAALHLVRDHGLSCAVLEAGHIGWGASGRNGGIVGLNCTKRTIRGLEETYGEAETRAFLNSQVEAVDLVAGLIAEHGIAAEAVGDAEFGVSHDRKGFEALTQLCDGYGKYGIGATLYTQASFAREFYDAREQHGALKVHCGFAINPLRLVQGLAHAAAAAGARLFPRSAVLEWRREAGGHMLVTRTGTVRAKRVIVAVNGFLDEGLHFGLAGRFLPVISNILVTEPLSPDLRAAHNWRTLCPMWSTRTLLFYYRMLPDGRFLFGARGDTSGRAEDGARMRGWMERRLAEVFPHWAGVKTEHFWRGLICMTRNRVPALGLLDGDESVSFAMGYHGNGVNSAVWAGRALARALALGKDGWAAIPAIYRGGAPRFPFPELRRLYLAGAFLYYRATDR
ncbi:NAD(P)/FAD-dependent oxidoreductase [Futiania mangrovi]|uniref:FAD-binding oxidoreductase n=1 Tax=Futiania mangrovi TaxID=2959716 RepID=A0A9J6PH14_9PROT|nr:FAD-binding oxidoreductase [Futiania mangrovii]MCP1335879.1 FAD-binding oxidoreductase [Futiania mangrovii]